MIPSRREGLRQWKISNDSIGNRTCGLQACSAVRQPTAPPRTPNNSVLSGLTSISLAFFPHMFRTILRTNSDCCIKEKKTVALCNVGAVFSVRQELNFLMVCGWTYWLQRFERLCYVIVSFFYKYLCGDEITGFTDSPHTYVMLLCCIAGSSRSYFI
jgi:hypothetical protein